MKDLTNLINRPVAHRGLHNIKEGIPENSILAYKKAMSANYNIELDVHLTKDNKVVVFHDSNIKRVCGKDKIIEESTYEELLKYNLFNTKYKIPLLSEVLSLVDGKVFLLIETKVLKFDGKLELELSKILDNYKGGFAIHSFNILSVNWFRKNRNNYIRGLLSSDFNKWNMNFLHRKLRKTMIIDILLKTDFISYDLRALPNSYVTSKRKRKPVLAWTIRNKEEYDKAIIYADNLVGENFDEYI